MDGIRVRLPAGPYLIKMIKFTKSEIEKLKKDKIFRKELNKKIFWIKPLYEHKTYPQGNHLNHRKFFNILKIYLKDHIPNYIIKHKKLNNGGVMIIIQEEVLGKKINLREIKNLLKLKTNRNFKLGLKRLLKRNFVLDFYAYHGNFIESKKHKIVYIDTRMPIFCNKSEERYKISRVRTLNLLGQ